MRRFTPTALAAALGMLSLASSPTRADTQATGVARVLVTVPPSIAVAPIQPLWDLSTVQKGSFSAIITWRVEANVQSIQMMLEASDLYKADDPSNTEIAPVPLDSTRPADILAEHATATNGAGSGVSWIGPGAPINNFPTMRSDTVIYESSQLGTFSQLVTTRVYYDQQDAIKPMGQYGGRVRITTLIPPMAALGR